MNHHPSLITDLRHWFASRPSVPVVNLPSFPPVVQNLDFEGI